MEKGKDTANGDKVYPDLGELAEMKDVLCLAAELFESDAGFVRFVDPHLIKMDLKWGDGMPSGELEYFFYDHVLKNNGTVTIPNLTESPNSAEVLPVLSASGFRSFVGVPLLMDREKPIGVICLFGKMDKAITLADRRILDVLFRQVELIVENKIKSRTLLEEIHEKEARTDSLQKIAQLQSHQIRRPLTTIMGLVNLIKEGIHPIDAQWIEMFEISTRDFDKTIHQIVEGSLASKDLKAIRFNKMVEEIDDYAILILDGDGYIENWNKGAERIKGYGLEEIVGQHFSIFYTEEGKKNGRPQQLIREAEEQGVARDLGWRIRKDGTRFWCSVVITSIHANNGEVIGFTKVTRDLTEITEVRDSLIASEELYNMILEKSQALARIGGWEFDVVRNLLSWTSITKEIHCVPEEYVPELATAIQFYKEGEDREKITGAVRLAIERGIPWDLELRILTKQGNEVLVRATGKSNYKDGICTKVYGTFQEIDPRSGC